jgi:hypothetical protein
MSILGILERLFNLNSSCVLYTGAIYMLIFLYIKLISYFGANIHQIEKVFNVIDTALICLLSQTNGPEKTRVAGRHALR